jgi:chromosome segregation ATPase
MSVTLEEIVRQKTLELRDSVGLLENRCGDLRAEREAAEDRLKRASSEISARHSSEHEAKQARNEAELKVAEVRSQLDEIERQRSELIERLMELQRGQEDAEHGLKEAKVAAERAEDSMRQARGEVERIARQLEKVLEERTQHQRRLRQAYAVSLEEYLDEVTRRLEQATAGEQDRQRCLVALEAFRKARHEDAEIGNRCDQRDQLRELLKLATVPAVREKLQQLLADLEKELNRLYPGALSLEERTSKSAVVEELYYFTNREGRTSILVPVTEITWKAMQEGLADIATTAAMRTVWSVVSELGLKPSDGEFRMEGHRCVFSSNFASAEISTLVALSVSAQECKDIHFRLAPLPSEMQEALVDET